MRILVTGCSGYIGQRLIARLASCNYEVFGIDRTENTKLPADRFITCDLLQVDRYRNLLKQIDLICHLAAARNDWGISRGQYYLDNLEATRTLMSAANAAGIRRWLFYSTVSALGASGDALTEESPLRPDNPYGASKAACEELFDRYVAEEPNAHVVTLRPSMVFGPGIPQNNNFFRLVRSIHRGRFVMVGNGRAVKTTSFIDNLLDAHMFLMGRQLTRGGRGHEVYQYVDGPGRTTAWIVEQVYKNLDKPASRLRVPLAIASPLAMVADLTAAVLRFDLPITRARIRKFCTPTNFSAKKIQNLGFNQRVSDEHAIRQTVQWYLNGYSPAAAAG